MNNRRTALRSLVVLTVVSAVAASHASILGVAGDYNMFVQNNVNVSYTDVEGRSAIGGNVTTTGMEWGQRITSGPQNALVVGGNLNMTNGSIRGNAIVGGSANVTNTGFSYGGTLQSGNPINFNGAFSQLRNTTSYLNTLAANGTVDRPYSTLNLRGTSTGLNVFNVTADQLWNSSDVQFFVPTGATVVVNVSGSNVRFKNYGYGLNGLSRNNLLWNVAGANASYDYLEGSLLAPNADITTGWGVIQGQVIAKSWTGNSQTNLHLFTGNVPPAAPVPEPASMAVFGLSALAFLRRRKQK
ncbi:MAG: choice-of-anchor A family protein [Fimbriimonadaceae bacterium]|nr:choice-of-anchor A family protein [Fimbriimonadaceae bacterium]